MDTGAIILRGIIAALPILLAVVGTALRLRGWITALLALLPGAAAAALLAPELLPGLPASFPSALPTILEVCGIILGGLLLSRILDAAGAQKRIADWCSAASSHPSSSALLVVLGIEAFSETVTGFGVGIAIAVPILRHLGFGALSSATMALSGLVVTVWGGLSPGSLVAAQLAGLDLTEVGLATAWTVWPSSVLAGLVVVWIAHPDRRPGHLHLVEGAIAGLVLAGGIVAANALVGTPLAGALGGLATIVALLVRFRLGGDPTPAFDATMRRAVAPYGLLLGALLPLNLWLRIAGATGPVRYLASPALWLVVVALASLVWFGMDRAAARATAAAALRAWRPIAIVTVLYMTLGWLLTASGLSAAMAAALALLGPVSLALAPLLGALGGFLTGSNTGANAMFTGSASELSQLAGVSALGPVGAASQAGAVGTMCAPARVALAAGVAASAQQPGAAASAASLAEPDAGATAVSGEGPSPQDDVRRQDADADAALDEADPHSLGARLLPRMLAFNAVVVAALGLIAWLGATSA